MRRTTAGCSAWFYCEDERGCVDWQTQLPVQRGFCVLMSASARPQPEPRYEDVTKPLEFFNYQAGYPKGKRLQATYHCRCPIGWEDSRIDVPEPQKNKHAT